MSYDTTKLTKLAALKALAERTKATTDALDSRITTLGGRVDSLEAAGGEPNVITQIKVNGTAQAITNKAVDIKMPTKVSDLTNDSKYQTDTQVSTAIQTAISKSGHAAFQKVDAVPSVSTAQDNILYLVMNSDTGHYDIYAKVGTEVVLLDDTTVDLSGKVDKVEGKGLSTNDYTTAEKNKLAGLSNYTHPSYTAKANGLYKVTVDETGHVSAATAVAKSDITALGIPAQDTTYTPATTTKDGLMSSADKSKLDGMNIAADTEVTEVLNEVFGVSA